MTCSCVDIYCNVPIVSMAVFKVKLDGSLSNLVKWKASLLMTGALELDKL